MPSSFLFSSSLLFFSSSFLLFFSSSLLLFFSSSLLLFFSSSLLLFFSSSLLLFFSSLLLFSSSLLLFFLLFFSSSPLDSTSLSPIGMANTTFAAGAALAIERYAHDKRYVRGTHRACHSRSPSYLGDCYLGSCIRIPVPFQVTSASRAGLVGIPPSLPRACLCPSQRQEWRTAFHTHPASLGSPHISHTWGRRTAEPLPGLSSRVCIRNSHPEGPRTNSGSFNQQLQSRQRPLHIGVQARHIKTATDTDREIIRPGDYSGWNGRPADIDPDANRIQNMHAICYHAKCLGISLHPTLFQPATQAALKPNPQSLAMPRFTLRQRPRKLTMPRFALNRSQKLRNLMIPRFALKPDPTASHSSPASPHHSLATAGPPILH